MPDQRDRLAWLGRAWAALDARLAALPPEDLAPAHGDAHAGNLLLGAAGWLWSDFEDASRMPRHWDVACAVFRWPLLGEDAAWAQNVQRLALGPSPSPADQRGWALALRARAVQSVCGGLKLTVGGLTAPADVWRRLDAARRLLPRLGLL